MVMTSVQIAQLQGGYQSQAMGRMQQASMIGQGGPQYGGGQSSGEEIFGRTAQGVGAAAPWVGGAATIGGGMVGGAAMGAGVGLAVGAGVAAIGYAGGQMMQGMQQQTQFNSMMRQNYSHLGGSQGLQRGQLSGMHEEMRAMSMQKGPMGERVDMGELQRLASNMGRMGMAGGASTAREFSQKFKQMVTTLKDVATTLGTSLEDAQKMMAGMKQTGVFGMQNQAAAAKVLGASAMQSGLSTQEIQTGGFVGSQISRSIGGRGAQGNIAGIKTMRTIGMAQQAGVISEEDIYNVTGLTGAEGRQAYGTQIMSSSAKFLKGRFGRHALAAMMGEGGKVDEQRYQDMKAGKSVGFGGGARRNPAAFLRNEGRMRGELLARDPLIGARMMGNWLKQRGMDPATDSDRAMIGLQRFAGLGTEEAEQMVKLIQNMPLIERAGQERARRLGHEKRQGREMAYQRSHSGIQGIKKKFSEAKEKIDSKLQQMGSDFQSDITDSIDSWLNEITGTYVQQIERDLGQQYDQAIAGGKMAGALFGMGGTRERMGQITKRLGDPFGGRAKFSEGDMVKNYKKFNADRMKEAGYGITAAASLKGAMGGKSEADVIRQNIAGARAIAKVTLKGGGGSGTKESRWRSLGTKYKETIRQGFATGEIGGEGLKGRDRLESFMSHLRKSGASEEDMKAFEELTDSGDMETAAAVTAMGNGAGMAAGEAAMFAVPGLRGIGAVEAFGTHGDRQRFIGAAFRGLGTPEGASEASGFMAWAGRNAAVIGGVAGGVLGGLLSAGIGSAAGAAGGASLFSHLAGASSRLQDRAAGQFAESERGRDLTSSVFHGSKVQQSRTRLKIQRDLQNLNRQGKDITNTQKGERSYLRGLLATGSYMKMSEGGRKELSAEQWQEIANENKMTVEDAKGAISMQASIDQAGMDRRVNQAADMIGEEARREAVGLEKRGIVTGEPGSLVVSKDAQKALAKGGIGEGDAFMEGLMEKMNAEAGMRGGSEQIMSDSGGGGALKQGVFGGFGQASTAAINRMHAETQKAASQKMRDAFRGMSLEERQEKVAALKDAGFGGRREVQQLGFVQSVESAVQAAGKRTRGTIGLARQLRAGGVNLGQMSGERANQLMTAGRNLAGGAFSMSEIVEAYKGLSDEDAASGKGAKKLAQGLALRLKSAHTSRVEDDIKKKGWDPKGEKAKDYRQSQAEDLDPTLAKGIEEATALIARGDKDGEGTRKLAELREKNKGEFDQLAKGQQQQDNPMQAMAQSLDSINTNTTAANVHLAGILAKDFSGGSCFPGYVKVTMSDGSTKPIEEIAVGDEVLSACEDTGKMGARCVTKTFDHALHEKEVLVEVNGVTVTTNHPISFNGGWTQVRNVKLGDTIKRLVNRDFVTEKVVSLHPVSVADLMQRGISRVYNFEVADYHTYFAGGMWVHNGSEADAEKDKS